MADTNGDVSQTVKVDQLQEQTQTPNGGTAPAKVKSQKECTRYFELI